MRTQRRLTGTLDDILSPTHRIIHFSDEPHIVTVLTHIRALWITLPPSLSSSSPQHNNAPTTPKASNPNASDLDPWNIAREYPLNAQQTGYVGLELNPESQSIHTLWRKKLAQAFNHVFVDVMSWLPNVNCSVGHFHPPNHDVFGIPFSLTSSTTNHSDGGGVVALTKMWETNVLLIPAFLAQGVRIKAVVEVDAGEGNEEVEVGTFDASNASAIWFLRAGVRVSFYVIVEPGSESKAEQGLAAVMATAELCTDNHGLEDHCQLKSYREASVANKTSKTSNPTPPHLTTPLNPTSNLDLFESLASKLKGNPLASYAPVRQGLVCGPGGCRRDVRTGEGWWECGAECGALGGGA